MPEIFFSCHCGLMLKVRDDQAAGSEITCPACNESVAVPSVGEAWVAQPESLEDTPTPEGGKAFAIAYLAATAIVTLVLVKYLLLPALDRPAEVALSDAAGPEARPAAAEPVEKKPPDDEEVTPPKDPKPAIMPPTPAVPDPGPSPGFSPALGSVAGVADPAPRPADPPGPAIAPGSTILPPEAGPSPAPKNLVASPYAHLSNQAARQKLELALGVLKKRDLKAVSTAELFLRSAESAAIGDPAVQIEVKKLRDRIAGMGLRRR